MHFNIKKLIQLDETINDICFYDNDTKMIVCTDSFSNNATLLFIDLEEGSIFNKSGYGYEMLMSFAYLKKENTLLFVASDGLHFTLVKQNLDTSEEIFKKNLSRNEFRHKIVVNKEETVAVILSNVMELFDLKTGELIEVFQSFEDDEKVHAVFDPDENIIYCFGVEKGKIILYDYIKRESVKVFKVPVPSGKQFSLSPMGKYLLISNSGRKGVCLLERNTFKQIYDSKMNESMFSDFFAIINKELEVLKIARAGVLGYKINHDDFFKVATYDGSSISCVEVSNDTMKIAIGQDNGVVTLLERELN